MEKHFEHNEVLATVKTSDPVPVTDVTVTLTLPLSHAKALLALAIPSYSDQVHHLEKYVGAREADFLRSIKEEDPFYNIYYVLDDALQAVNQRAF